MVAVAGRRHSFASLPSVGATEGTPLNVSRAHQESMHNLERMKLARETELIRQRALQQRSKLEAKSVRLRSDIAEHMHAAREQAHAINQATRHEREILRRARAELASERASFDHEMRRREAAFKTFETQQRKREANRRRESATAASTRSNTVVPPPLATAPQLARFAAFERAFAAFEASAAVDLVADGLPWPPDDCPVSGVRRTDSDAARKQRLKKAMLRWHPDKFLATNGTRIRPDELPAVTERLGAVLQRVQQERHAYGCATGVE